jgi:hypothetical protein
MPSCDLPSMDEVRELFVGHVDTLRRGDEIMVLGGRQGKSDKEISASGPSKLL